MAGKFVFINHKIVAEAEAQIGFSDLAIQRGYGVFDFLKVVAHQPVFMDEHLNRFYNSAATLYLDLPSDRQQLKQIITDLIRKNDMANSGVKITLTGGYSEDGYSMGKSNLIISQYPLSTDWKVDEPAGMKLVSYNHQRQLPYIKTIDYLQSIRLQPFMREHGGQDILYHCDGSVRECPRANFFIVTDDEVITPKTDVLYGITRSKILDMHITGYKVTEKDFSTDDLRNAREAFISSTTKNAYPVTHIDGKPIGDGQLGPVAREIRKKLLKLMSI